MTLSSSSPVTLSSLSEASVAYLTWLSSDFSGSVHHLIRRLVTVGSQQPRSALSTLEPLPTRSLAALVCTIVIGVLAVIAMSWRDPFNFWRRPSYDLPVSPQVSDSDFSYLTGDDIVDPPRAYESPPYVQRRPQAAGETGPDLLLLKHRGVTYPLHFAPYAIDDRVLTVGAIRQLAAEKTGTTDPQRIRMLYKGKLLRDDSRPCKDEGLKQQSEIMCVVSEVRPGESTSDLSGSEEDRSSEPVSTDGGDRSTRHRDRKKKNKKKKKRGHNVPASSPTAEATSGSGNLAPPTDQRPTSSGRSSAAPSPAPSLAHLRSGPDKVDALLTWFRASLAPLCEEYIAHPPSDPKTRDFEHKRLSETILAQVIMKADSIDSEDARTERRALIKEAQAMLTKLDQAAPRDT